MYNIREKMYNTSDACDILSTAGACRPLSVDHAVLSQARKEKIVAMDELRAALYTLMASERPFAAVYVVPTLTVLICSLKKGVVSVVDTYTVPKRCGGDDRHGAVVSTVGPHAAIPGFSAEHLRRRYAGCIS